MSHLHPGRRRSARLRSQIHSSGDERSELPRPPSTRLHPKIDATEDGTGVSSHRRSSKRRSSQIQESEGGDRVTRGKRPRPQTHASEVGDGTSPEPPASPLQVDDLLREILLRLPLDLHSLFRASAVCKPWRGIVVDPKFLRRFYARHRKPPLLGFFQRGDQQLMFTPVMAPAPDRILPGSFDLGQRYSHVLDSRHGRVLLSAWPQIVMYDPITSKQHRMSIPPWFMDRHFSAAMLCAASDEGHVHGACHSYPFKVVLVSIYREGQPIACVYSSETATWGGLISTEAPHDGSSLDDGGTLVGNVLYWPLHRHGDTILEFDLDMQNLTVTKGPPIMNMIGLRNLHIIEADDGAVGLAVVSRLKLLMWQRKIDCQGIPVWFLQKTVTWRKLLQITKTNPWPKLVGYDEDNNVILLARYGDGVYMVQPKSMQARKLNGSRFRDHCYTFTSFDPLGTTIAGGTDGAEMLG